MYETPYVVLTAFIFSYNTYTCVKSRKNIPQATKNINRNYRIFNMYTFKRDDRDMCVIHTYIRGASVNRLSANVPNNVCIYSYIVINRTRNDNNWFVRDVRFSFFLSEYIEKRILSSWLLLRFVEKDELINSKRYIILYCEETMCTSTYPIIPTTKTRTIVVRRYSRTIQRDTWNTYYRRRRITIISSSDICAYLRTTLLPS